MVSYQVGIREEETLKERLDKLEGFEGLGDNLKVSLDPKELTDAKNGILTEFYNENPLAHDVAKGKDLYERTMNLITKKYDSFWKRITKPKPDQSFDEKVREVFYSANKIGMKLVDSELFTTEGRGGIYFLL